MAVGAALGAASVLAGALVGVLAVSANGRDRGYITWRPTRRICAKLDAIQDVLATYHDHLPMTVRQIFYVLVARLVIRKTALEYRNLAYVLRKARRARIIPFEHIHDQGSTLPATLLGFSAASRPRVVDQAPGANFRP